MSGDEYRLRLASLADHNAVSIEEGVDAGEGEVSPHRKCKEIIELDRSRWAREAGYEVTMY